MEQDDTDVTVVRQQDFDCAGPVELCVELGNGRLDVRLIEPTEAAATVGVQIRPDPTGRPPWNAGVAGLLTWLGEQAGAATSGDLAAEAVRHTLIDCTGQRLTVRTPQDAPLRSVALTIQLTAPAGSALLARSGSADVLVDGVAGRLDASTGAGQVRAQQCTGGVDIRTGAGDVRLGSVLGTLRVRTGSGAVDVISIGNDISDVSAAGADSAANVQTGSGNVRFGAVRRDVTARSGSGDLVVVDASAGRLELTSGSGQLRVGIQAGVLAEVDISSGSGEARSDLPVGEPPTDGDVGLRVRARTGSGDALITSAPS
ncbi:MAG: DUF4097 family beta strand repeat-containing protein [Pseudonocardiaceae bacterium]